jgi:hypothetical protein
MRIESNVDPVSRIIKECHRGEDVANRIFQTITQEHQHRIFLADNTELELNEEQVGEFVARFSSEVEPQYWHSKRRKD